MTTLRWVRRAAALLLLAAMFLPLSRCSRQADGSAGTDGSEGAAVPHDYRYSYAWTDFNPRNAGSWLIFLAFLWPVPFVAREMDPRRRSPAWLSAVQLLPAAGAGLLVHYRTFLEELWVGGYLAYIALGCYSAALLVEIAAAIARWSRTKKAARESTGRLGSPRS
jgi:hypothetical protein